MYNIYICVFISYQCLVVWIHIPISQAFTELRWTCSSCGFCAPLSALAVSPTDMTRKACT